MVRLLLALFLALAPAATAHADDTAPVLIDQPVTGVEQDFDVQVPADLAPGHHRLLVEVYDDAGTVSQKYVSFCKDSDGTVHWDDECASTQVGLDPFDPTKDPGGTLTFFATALALLVAFESSSSGAGRERKREISEVDAGSLLDRHSEQKWGDASVTWRLAGGRGLERVLHRLAERAGRVSRIVSRTAADAAYIRAMLGLLYLPLPVLGAWLGWLAQQAVQGDAVPPPTAWLIVLIAIGTADAFAGLLAALAFSAGVIMAGGVTTSDHLFTLAGLMPIMFAPALLASSVRPLRRYVYSSDDRWERISDFALAALFGGWAVAKMVQALASLSGTQFAVIDDATTIGKWTAAFILVRFTLEEFAHRVYPQRLEVVTPADPQPWRLHRPITRVLKAALFVFLLIPYIGTGWELYAGTAIFLMPTVFPWMERRLPKNRRVRQYIPKGVLKTLAMLFIGVITGHYFTEAVKDPTHAVRWGFVVLSLPGLLLAVLALTGDSDHDHTSWRTTTAGRRVYRLGGVAVFIAMGAAALGHDITGWMFAH